MGFWILVFSMLIAFIAIYFSGLSIGTGKDNMICGVTLPPEACKYEEVIEIKSQYKKDYKRFGVIFVISFLPMLLIRNSFSASFVYSIIWILGGIYFSHVPYKKANAKLTELKKGNNWIVGEKKKVSIDTKVSRLKDTMVVAPYWFLIPLGMSLSFLIGFPIENPLSTIMGISSLAITIFLYLVYRLFVKEKTKVYSDDSNINLAINRVYRGYWSGLWLFLAIYQSITAYIIYWSIESMVSNAGVVIVLLIITTVPLVSVLYVANKIKSITTEITALSNKEYIIIDEDDYWIGGIFYNNPSDKSVLVEKRFGMGMTVNLATRTGKVVTYGSFVLMAAILIPILLFAVVSDLSGHAMEITETQEVQIKTILYGHTFKLNDVEEIALVDNMPSSFRTNGVGTSSYSRGNYTVRDYGKSKLYIYNDNPPYIVIKLDDIYVFYNEKNPDDTMDLYESLLENIR